MTPDRDQQAPCDVSAAIVGLPLPEPRLTTPSIHDEQPWFTAEQVRSRLQQAAALAAGVERDARRYRWLRNSADMTWAGANDGEVKWVFYLRMADPDISAEALTEDSVRRELDAAIDKAAGGDHGKT